MTSIVSEDFDALTWMSAYACHGPKTVRVLLALWSHVDNTTCRAHPSLETLAAESGISRRNVIKQLNSAVEDGWITVVEKGYRGRATEYRLTLPAPLPWIASEDKSDHRDNCRCRSCFTCRCAWCREHGQTDARADAVEAKKCQDAENRVTNSTGKGDEFDQYGDEFAECSDASVTPTSLRTSLTNFSQENFSLSGSACADPPKIKDEDDLARRGEKTKRGYPLHVDFVGNAATLAKAGRLGIDHDEALRAFHGYMNEHDHETSRNWGGTLSAFMSSVVEDLDSEHYERFWCDDDPDNYFPSEDVDAEVQLDAEDDHCEVCGCTMTLRADLDDGAHLGCRPALTTSSCK
ncbi:helix-turn-helix domain-containing protein [Gordonia polyisoprenivorans]|uniref:helix-turn-helix domain-containing protein n=1 Tax=Gordonia polyisoprenivorans TaxID=84595 RepID=UPI001AD79269|nr:helix-turn-helix domain-containing protein [Gordonia polyisoprenivorans]QTI67648.1 helix-turn-helix domain-containing protein [Gordonia polyisoprenivorans]